MQAFLDLIPVVAFFVTYKLSDIYVATGVLIAATVIQLLVQWLRTRKISRMMLISTVLVLVFGAATLIVHDELFIMWKPTVLYLLFAAAFVLSQFIGDQPLLQRLLGSQLRTDARTWRVANLAWAAFFVVLAAVNLVFVYRFSRDAWVDWKLAAIGVVFVFAVAQVAWLTKRADPVDPLEKT